MALYVYGIMRSDDAAGAVSDAVGDHQLEAVDHRGLSAVVETLPAGELRLRRDNILAHADILRAVFEHGPVLPFRFGTAVADPDSVVRELLAPTADRLSARLTALENKAEMQVKAVYAEEPLLRSILAGERRLAEAAQRLQSLPPAATHFERISIGAAITAAVKARGEVDQAALTASLAPLAVAYVASPPHNERAVLNAAFLVEAEKLEEFDRAVESLSEERGAEIEFKLIGPMPPYSFADRDWNASAEEVGAGWVS